MIGGYDVIEQKYKFKTKDKTKKIKIGYAIYRKKSKKKK